jgi:hypothetical protein
VDPLIQFIRDLAAWVAEAPANVRVEGWHHPGTVLSAGPMLDDPTLGGSAQLWTGTATIYRCQDRWAA